MENNLRPAASPNEIIGFMTSLICQVYRGHDLIVELRIYINQLELNSPTVIRSHNIYQCFLNNFDNSSIDTRFK